MLCVTVVCVSVCMYGTNHTKLNVLQVYPLCEDIREMGTDKGVPVPIPVPILLFTLYRN